MVWDSKLTEPILMLFFFFSISTLSSFCIASQTSHSLKFKVLNVSLDIDLMRGTTTPCT